MLGSFYYMRFKSDWAYTSVYDMLYKRNLQSIAKKQNIDLAKLAALQDYVESLENKLRILD